jgi:hypothetical protein
MKVPLAGLDAAGRATETILSEVGVVLLRMFDTREACTLRLVCREFVEAVRMQQWGDRDTVVRSNFAGWRVCFPRARACNIFLPSGAAPDFAPFQGLRELNMALCEGVTDDALRHLQGHIKVLDISGCALLTDAAFPHLAGLHTLLMSDCAQEGITDAAFASLRGIHTLEITGCWQLTDAALSPLRGIHTLYMGGCEGITDAAFVHLRGIHTLDIGRCWQLTDAALAPLRGVHTLRMRGCEGLTGAALAHLRGIHTLDLSHCCNEDLTPAALAHLAGVQVLSMAGCSAELCEGALARGLPATFEEEEED